MLLIIDNFDSFTYNIVQAFEVLDVEVITLQCSKTTLQECLSLDPKWIVIGPGPGAPSQAKLSLDLIKACNGSTPILGVCLGHQCIAEAFGGKVIRAKQPFHGKTSPIFHSERGVFSILPQAFLAGRYHSLIVAEDSLPSDLVVTAKTADGEIMGLKHRTLPIEGVQFHPESILSEQGSQLFQNFLNYL